ncbi:Imidazolonepropionase [Pseudoalteromonas holothuriae]|uniref:Imidazolonepropionase n=1 Tax=Pseudoalteromonas holothuriae TaxID=2963714 RepID=A0A9W4QT80_9GAMM|nr:MULTISPECIES: amidohydrolase family protein [unclassified Pseudoalteromonas]CAH9052039.1 Imidazolonepropionase [Pseudoalteromonas sp. CIP111854]CAH9057583.1 Imidazolonepropionase [Pseudoalteromonas sp. CIP111951]
MFSLINIKSVAVIIYTTLLLGCVSSEQKATQNKYAQQDIAYVNGQFFNQSHGFESKAIIIREGIVIANVNALSDNFPGKVIDLQGKWGIPGLIDMHTHSFGNFIPNAKNDAPGTQGVSQRVLKAGVTGLVDLFGDETALVAVRNRQRNGEFVGADIYASLTCFTAPKGHCSEYGITTRTVSTVKQAQKQMAELAKQKPDVIKIVYQPSDDQPSISKAVFAQLVQESKKLGIKSIAHIKTWQDIRDAAKVGVSAVTHVPRGEIPKDIADLMANADVAIIPTLSVHNDFVNYLFDPSVLNSPLLTELVPDTLISAYRANDLIAKYQDRKTSFQQRNEVTLNAVKAMSDAGVKVLVGTDAGNWNTVQGYSVHREMKLLTDAGISPLQAIASATTHSADFLGIKSGFNEGEHANFVILNASPVDDILNTQQIALVVKSGNIVVQNDPSLSKL